MIELRSQPQPVQAEPRFDIRVYLGRNWLGTAMQRWIEEAPVKIRLTLQQAERLRQRLEQDGLDVLFSTLGLDAVFVPNVFRVAGGAIEATAIRANPGLRANMRQA